MQDYTSTQIQATQHLPLTHEILCAALHVSALISRPAQIGEELAALKRSLFAAADMAYELEKRAAISPEDSHGRP